jgi:effector-binding domain-containing protein
MKILKKIIIWLVILILLLIGVAYLLPGSYHVERTILIKTDAKTVYGMVCDFNKWDLWTPWSSESDTTATIENIGNCEIGALQKWDGKEMGKGQMEVTEIVPLKMLKWNLQIEGFSQKMIIGMTFEKEGDDYLLTWTADGELGYNPLYRYYGLTIDSDLGEDYEKGLQQLKELCEALPDYPGIGVTEVTSVPAISVKDSVPVAEIGLFMETYMPQLYIYVIRQGGKMAGHPYSINYNWDPDGMILVEAGVPLEEAIAGEGVIKATNSPGGKAVKAAYFGPYEDIAPVYEALEQYITVMKMEFNGAPWEVYITDPSEEPDPMKWETIVYFPIK